MQECSVSRTSRHAERPGQENCNCLRSPPITLGNSAVSQGQFLGVTHGDCWINSILL